VYARNSRLTAGKSRAGVDISRVITSSIDTKSTPRNNLGPQTAPSLERLFGTLMKSLIHPEAGTGFLGPQKPSPVDLKFLSNQIVEVLTLNNHIATIGFRPLIVH